MLELLLPSAVNATCLADLLRGCLCFGIGFNGGLQDEFFAMRRKEFLCEREGNSKVV
jgi:hypothetical protein